MSKKHGYIGGVVLIVGGGFLTRYVDASSGAALVAAGGFLLGAIQREWWPKAAVPGPVTPEKSEAHTTKGPG